MSVKVLVTGSNGQLGKCLHEIKSFFPDFIFDFKSKNELDICNEKQLIEILSNNYDYLINTAAYTKVDQAELDSEACYRVNKNAVELLAKYCNPDCKIIHISTDYVYHHNPSRLLFTNDHTWPQSIYAKSKLAGETALLNLRPDSLIIRTSWVYSQFGSNFVKTMLKLGSTKENLNIVSDQHGSPTNAMDLAKALLNIISFCEANLSTKTQKRGVYHYSNSGVTQWSHFAETIFKLTKTKCKVNPIRTLDFSTMAIRPKWSVLSKEKLINDFGINIKSWEESLKECLKVLGY